MSRSIPTSSFLTLPPELRVMIYEQILSASADAPTLPTLEQYCGLILSCREIKAEFEHEWVKAFNAWLTDAASGANLRPTLLSKQATLLDARHISFLISYEKSIWLGGEEGHESELARLSTNLKSFSVRLDDSWPILDNTVRGFLDSDQYSALYNIREDLLPEDEAQHESTKSNLVVLMDYWRPQLFCSRTSSIVQNVDQSIDQGCSLWPEMPRSFRYVFLFWTIIRSCTTMDELRQYRGLLYASRTHRKAFEWHA